jgi:NAD(P)H-hydrate epimerase
VVDVLLLGSLDQTSGDARTNFEIVEALAETGEGLGFREIHNGDELWDDALESADLYIDAIFGTGLTREPEGIYAEAINILAEVADAPIVAVDLPSGLASDSPEVEWPHVRADLTVTFTTPKIACALPPAVFECGEVEVVPIGSPTELIERAGSRLTLVTPELASVYLATSTRTSDAHKGNAGRVLVVAGARGKTGAAALTGLGAMRAGAGLVVVGAPQSAEGAIASRSTPEIMTEPLAETPSGALGIASLTAIARHEEWADVVAIGPGLGTDDETKQTVFELVRDRKKPVVLDADALNCLSPWPTEITGSAELPIIVTPHPAEMARLLGTTTDEVVGDRIGAARKFAERSGAITVLKGARTLVAEPSGEVFINPTGNAGMATGGSGDVLTGVVAALASVSPAPLVAAVAAVYIHGLAGDIAAVDVGVRALVAGDIAESLGEAFVEAGGVEERP